MLNYECFDPFMSTRIVYFTWKLTSPHQWIMFVWDAKLWRNYSQIKLTNDTFRDSLVMREFNLMFFLMFFFVFVFLLVFCVCFWNDFFYETQVLVHKFGLLYMFNEKDELEYSKMDQIHSRMRMNSTSDDPFHWFSLEVFFLNTEYAIDIEMMENFSHRIW